MPFGMSGETKGEPGPNFASGHINSYQKKKLSSSYATARPPLILFWLSPSLIPCLENDCVLSAHSARMGSISHRRSLATTKHSSYIADPNVQIDQLCMVMLSHRK